MSEWQLATVELKKFAGKVALLDTNVLLLLLSSQAKVSAAQFKRIANFNAADTDLLRSVLGVFRSTVTTTSVLSECSNLANSLTGDTRLRWFYALKHFAVVTPETHIACAAVGGRDEFLRFGYTDSALLGLSHSHVVVTSDARLAGYMEDLGMPVLNFEHLRLMRIFRP